MLRTVLITASHAQAAVVLLMWMLHVGTALAVADASPVQSPLLKAALSAVPSRKPGSPVESDVVFSIRFKERQGEGLRIARAFGATRVEWSYTAGDPRFASDVHRIGALVGGAINANVVTADDAGVAEDLDGHVLTAPWMKAWGAKWVTTTKAETRKALFALVDRYVDAGYDSIQVDDPILQAATVLWSGGDFSDITVAGFAQYLEDRVPSSELLSLGIEDIRSGFDLRAYLRDRGVYSAADLLRVKSSLPIMPLWSRYLRETVLEFYADLRRHLDRHPSGRSTALSMNVGPVEPRTEFLFPISYADYLLTEVPLESMGRMAVRVGVANAHGLGFVASVIPGSVAETRTALAGYYALGAQPLVPWDVFMGADDSGAKPRYFGRVEHYGDIFHFVRRHAALLDEWVIPPTVGLVVDLDARDRIAATMALAEKLTAGRVPFCVLPIGGDRPLAWSASRISGLRAIVVAGIPENAAVIAGLSKSEVPVYVGSDLTPERLKSLAPLTFLDPSAEAVIPHIKRSVSSAGMVVHFVGASPQESASVPLTVRRQDVCEKLVARTQLHTLSGEIVDIPMQAKGDVFIFEVPSRRSEYSLMHIECSNG